MSDTQLTDSQREAVECTEGPLLVVAGPGSGKTRVITHRIAKLVEQGVRPWSILAITFTNKAANEMAARSDRLLDNCSVWVTTFHKFCARMLRQYGGAVGLQSNFSIYDVSDQRTVIKRAMENLEIDPAHIKPSTIAQHISRAKNELQSPEDCLTRYDNMIGDHIQAAVAQVYPEYQKLLLEANAVDFDDLLLHVVTLLRENPELRSILDHKFKYILVDEYQDTNRAQYEIVSSLSQEFRNLCVTGDPDQSIYGWRGAQIRNILHFERDHPQSKVVRLEQNFRSTPNILTVADRLIHHNVKRKAKTLVPTRSSGKDVEIRRYADAMSEADHIAQSIKDAVKSGKRTWNDFAVFYRVNALTRLIEQAFMRSGVPYQVSAGLAFYERKEIKDLVAHLRLISNPKDQAAFQRIAENHIAGVGKTTLQRFRNHVERQGIDLLEACRTAKSIPKMSKKAATSLQRFAKAIDKSAEASADGVQATLVSVIKETEFVNEWQDNPGEESTQRLSNVDELVNAAAEYDQSEQEPTLDGFLERTSLVTDGDNIDPAIGSVKLMTLHAAKGLEFPVVTIVGLEHDLLPHERALKDDNRSQAMEEERRLLFVGITRAKDELLMTCARSRQVNGRPMMSIDSPFTHELDIPVQDHAGFGQLPAWASTGFAPSPESARRSKRKSRSATSTLEGITLTTADQLSSGGAMQNVELQQGFAIGSRVRHPQYGRGTVISTGGFSKNRTVTVEFAGGVSETFVVSMAPLEPIGVG